MRAQSDPPLFTFLFLRYSNQPPKYSGGHFLGGCPEIRQGKHYKNMGFCGIGGKQNRGEKWGTGWVQNWATMLRNISATRVFKGMFFGHHSSVPHGGKTVFFVSVLVKKGQKMRAFSNAKKRAKIEHDSTIYIYIYIWIP